MVNNIGYNKLYSLNLVPFQCINLLCINNVDTYTRLIIESSVRCAIMVGISETSDNLNGWSIVAKLFKIGLTNNLIQVEERDIRINIRKLLEKIILRKIVIIWMVQKN